MQKTITMYESMHIEVYKYKETHTNKGLFAHTRKRKFTLLSNIHSYWINHFMNDDGCWLCFLYPCHNHFQWHVFGFPSQFYYEFVQMNVWCISNRYLPQFKNSYYLLLHGSFKITISWYVCSSFCLDNI